VDPDDVLTASRPSGRPGDGQAPRVLTDRTPDRLRQSDRFVLVDLTADTVIASRGLVDTLERGAG
jgi:hypothetical protein